MNLNIDKKRTNPSKVFFRKNCLWKCLVGRNGGTRKYQAKNRCFAKNWDFRSFCFHIEPLIGDVGSLNLESIHWVIVGGESGMSARPMKPEWAIHIQKQCAEQKVSFFFKQWWTWGEKCSFFLSFVEKRVYLQSKVVEKNVVIQSKVVEKIIIVW